VQNRTPRVAVVLTAVASLTLAGCGQGLAGGEGERTILRLALNQSETHPSYIALDNFAQRLEESTDGRLSVDVYANETLGAQAEALQLVSDDIVELAIVSGTQLENLNPDFRVFNMPTVFDDVDHQMSVINDPAIVGDLFGSLADDQHITVLGGFTQGARHIYATRPVTTPEDMAGLKIRVQESPLHLSMINAMGGSGTPMAYGEVYTALQSGVLDGAENNEVSYFTQKHYEVADHLSTTGHLVGLDYLIINSDVLAQMSPEDRAAFDEEWRAAYTEHQQLWAAATEQAIADAKAGGAQFHDVDAEAFAEALAPLQDEFLTTPAQRALFDAARSAAGE
jgi:tripartite ATP-independent transporter DctP family solute receptor